MKDLETIRLLSKKLSKAEKEIQKLSRYKEEFNNMIDKCKRMERQLNLKRNVVMVQIIKDDVRYQVQLTKVIDTKDGLFIEGNLKS